MKRKFGVPALALIVALTSISTIAVPTQAAADNSRKVIGALIGGIIIGSALDNDKGHRNDRHVVEPNYGHQASRHHSSRRQHIIQQRRHHRARNYHRYDNHGRRW